MAEADGARGEPLAEGVGEARPGDADLRRKVHASTPSRDVDLDELLRLGLAGLELLDGDVGDDRSGGDDAIARRGVDGLERVQAVRPDEDGDARGAELLALLEDANVETGGLKGQRGGQTTGTRADDGDVNDVSRVVNRVRRRGRERPRGDASASTRRGTRANARGVRSSSNRARHRPRANGPSGARGGSRARRDEMVVISRQPEDNDVISRRRPTRRDDDSHPVPRDRPRYPSKPRSPTAKQRRFAHNPSDPATLWSTPPCPP